MSERRRHKSRPSPRPHAASAAARPAMPIVSSGDGSFDTTGSSQSFHAAALSLLEDEPSISRSGSGNSLGSFKGSASSSMRDLRVGNAKIPPSAWHADLPTADGMPDTVHMDDPRPDVDHEPPAPDVEGLPTTHRRPASNASFNQHKRDSSSSVETRKRLLDIQFAQRRASYTYTPPVDRDSPELDAVFEPAVPPYSTDSVFFQDNKRHSRSSSTYTLNEHSSSTLLKEVLNQDSLNQDSLDTIADDLLKLDDKVSDYTDLTTDTAPAPDTSEHSSLATMPASRNLANVAAFASVTPPVIDEPSIINVSTPPTKELPIILEPVAEPPTQPAAPPPISDLLSAFRKEELASLRSTTRARRAGAPLPIQSLPGYLGFCGGLWLQTGAACLRSVAHPVQVIHLLAFAFFSTVLPIILSILPTLSRACDAAKIHPASTIRSKLRRLEEKESAALWTCLSTEQIEAGKAALASSSRHCETKRVVDLDAARLLLHFNALLSQHVTPLGLLSSSSKDPAEEIRKAVGPYGIQYVAVSELNTTSSACCGAFYDPESNWIALSFKGESPSEMHEWIRNTTSGSVEAGQWIEGFGKVRSQYLERLFPRSLPSSGRLPYHMIIRTVRLLSTQFAPGHRINLYFTGHSAGGAIASLAMARALDAQPGEFGEGIEVRDGYVFGVPQTCDRRSVISFNHKLSRTWQNSRMLWRFVNAKDVLAQDSTAPFSFGVNRRLGLGLVLYPPSRIRVLGEQTQRINLKLSFCKSPKLEGSWRPERTLDDTASRTRRLVEDWPVVGGLVANSIDAYWDGLAALQDAEFRWNKS